MITTCNIIIYLDLDKTITTGLKFWKSDNGVILTEGNKKGYVLPEFFSKIIERKTGKLIS